jgi:hypothetical protein
MYSTLNMLLAADCSSTKNMEKGGLVLYCLMFQMFDTACPSFSISDLLSKKMKC